MNYIFGEFNDLPFPLCRLSLSACLMDFVDECDMLILQTSNENYLPWDMMMMVSVSFTVIGKILVDEYFPVRDGNIQPKTSNIGNSINVTIVIDPSSSIWGKHEEEAKTKSFIPALVHYCLSWVSPIVFLALHCNFIEKWFECNLTSRKSGIHYHLFLTKFLLYVCCHFVHRWQWFSLPW